MKKLVAAMLALALSAAPAFAVDGNSTRLLAYKISATDVATTKTPTVGTGLSTSVSIFNSDTANEIFVAFDGTATTDSAEIPAGASLSLDNFSVGSVSVICSTGETATVYLYITRQ